MHVSIFSTSLAADFGAAVRRAAALGFGHIDVVALAERPPADLEALADSSLVVSCAALGRGLPAGLAVDAIAVEARRAVLDILQRQVADAARLGATHAYLVPGTDTSPEGLTRFADLCRFVADFGGRRMVKVCVEHIPGRALPTAAGALAWLKALDHANLGLLLDVGHCLISGEDPAGVIEQAGARLGYVHWDDNDGVRDLHGPLLTGRLTEAGLREAAAALRQVGYAGVLALELNCDVLAGDDGLCRRNRELLERLVANDEGGANRDPS